MTEKETQRGRPRFGSEKQNAEKFVKFSCTLPPDVYARLDKYCSAVSLLAAKYTSSISAVSFPSL